MSYDVWYMLEQAYMHGDEAVRPQELHTILHAPPFNVVGAMHSVYWCNSVAYIHTPPKIHAHTYSHTYTHTHTHTRIHTHTRTQTHMRAHTHTHTHTHTNQSQRQLGFGR